MSFRISLFLILLAMLSVGCRTPKRDHGPSSPSPETSTQILPPEEAGKAASLQLTPETTTAFGRVASGASSELVIIVRNSGEGQAEGIAPGAVPAPFAFTGGSYPGFNGNCGLTLAAGATCSIVLNFTPSSTGSYSLSFSLSYSHAQGNGIAELGFTGFGVEPGGLDPTFGAAGKLTTAMSASFDEAHGVAFHDDKILVGGYSHNGANYDFALARYLSDGTLDADFGTGGKVTVGIGAQNDQAFAVAVQPDGKIILAGYAYNGSNNDYAISRFLTTGALDPSFGTGGKVMVDVAQGHDFGYAVALQSDGRILVAGAARVGSTDDFAVARLESDGSLDASFGTSGIATLAIGSGTDEARAVGILGDGKIVLGGSARIGSAFEFALARFEPDGSPDLAFNGTGYVTVAVGNQNDFAYALAVQANGRVLLAGRSHNGSDYDFALARFLPDGSLDASFDGDGKTTTFPGSGNDEARALVLQSDGKIVAAGLSYSGSTSYDFALARYTTDGAPDVSFAVGGVVTTSISSDIDRVHALAVAGDGGLVAAGDSYNGGTNDFAVAKFYP